jgi:glycosyltransferase involved in cell wall biosynthesis
MFLTTIIPTIGRKVLQRAIHSVLEQDFSSAEYEVIIINDSGTPLPEEDWQQSLNVRVLNSNRVERCVARNLGAAVAQGRYLHFLDDDDWLLPGALEAFWRLSHKHPNSPWLYGGTLLFDRHESPVIRLVHDLSPNCFTQLMAGEWIPLQASIIHHEQFHKVGGFDPLIPGVEDIDLARRMALHFDFNNTGELVAAVGMGTSGSTTNQAKARLDGRKARELILNEPGVYNRLWQSADNEFWRGRIVRLYLTSSHWNLAHGKLLTAISRTLQGLLAILSSMSFSLLTRDFWRAVGGQYESETFARGFAESQKVTVQDD